MLDYFLPAAQWNIFPLNIRQDGTIIPVVDITLGFGSIPSAKLVAITDSSVVVIQLCRTSTNSNTTLPMYVHLNENCNLKGVYTAFHKLKHEVN